MPFRPFRHLSWVLLALATFASPVAAAPLKAKADYAVTLGGTHIATVTIDFSDDGKTYKLGLNARISGLARMVASGSARLQSVGTSSGPELRSQKFDLLTSAGGQDIAVAVTYAAGDVNTFVVTPPIINNIDRVAIERRQLVGGINDMAAAFVLRGKALDKSLCERKLQIFTGVERFNLAMRYAREEVATSKRTGYQGPVVLCSVSYTPISGHYVTSEITTYLEKSERILIWYAPLKNEGHYIPYRALIATEAGDLSVVLTELQQ